MKTKKIILSSVFFLLSLYLASANVGVGVSPTKVSFEIESGKEYNLNLLVFNPGDSALEITISAEGDIKDLIEKIEPASEIIQPEPKPTSLPIKNGQNFVITFKAPPVSNEKKYIGVISAVGNPTSGSQFGGSVGVATQVEIIVRPSKSILANLSSKQKLVGLIIVLLIASIIAVKKSGFKIKFERNIKS